jgi:hypothetical protein
VFFGTWCGDSLREIPRLLRALEEVPEPYPFTIRWIGVDRTKVAAGYTDGAAIELVPTFVVRRDGLEIGRVVESAPRGIERELADLLSGATRGVIGARQGRAP